MSGIHELRKTLKSLATPERAKASAWFFKTGPGQYGEGDKFVGVSVPDQRKVARQFKSLPLSQVEELLKSPIHEERLVALFILVDQYKKGNEKIKKEIYEFYLANTSRINNWDLVDSSAGYILGDYLIAKPREVLYRLAISKNLWERRIAIIATSAFLVKGQFKDTFEISELLLKDKEDLIHKAVGWMLREVGKRISREELEKFLKTHYKTMPRTALRYSIEHFPVERRAEYLSGRV